MPYDPEIIVLWDYIYILGMCIMCLCALEPGKIYIVTMSYK